MNKEQQIKAIKDCARGDSAAQRMLFMEFSEMLLSTCKRYMGNEAEAKDVLQDSFMRIFKYAHTFNHVGGNLKGWMKTICIREALKQIKKKKRTASMDELEYIPTVDPIAVQNLDTEELHKLISELPEKQRTVFNLYVVEGYSHKEIANLLQVEEASSRSILSRTKVMLKKKLLNIKSKESWV